MPDEVSRNGLTDDQRVCGFLMLEGRYVRLWEIEFRLAWARVLTVDGQTRS
jgi:hypothetical protein